MEHSSRFRAAYERARGLGFGPRAAAVLASMVDERNAPPVVVATAEQKVA